MPSIRSPRRTLLVGCAALAGGFLSGCTSGPSADDSSSGSTLRFQMHRIGDSLIDRHVVDLEATRIPWDEEAFQAAIDGSDYTTRYHRPFPVRDGDEPAYARHEGVYYRLDSIVVGEEQVTRPVLRLYRVGRQGDSTELPDFTPNGALPAVDKRAIEIAHMAARARGNEGGYPVGLVERGGYVYRSEDRERRSRLLTEDGPSHVGYRDTVYRVDVTGETFYEPIYRPDVDPVAESEDEMDALLRGAVVDNRINPGSLTRDERGIVGRARSGGYEESHPFSDPFVSLLEALDRRAYIDGNIERDAGLDSARGDVLKYGEDYYDYHVRFES